MCKFELDKFDVKDVVEEQLANTDLLKTQLKGIYIDIFGHTAEGIAAMIFEQGPEGISPGVVHAFLIGLQLGQKYPTALYPGKSSPIEYGDGGEEYDEVGEYAGEEWWGKEYDEEEETELTFQSVRNS